MSNYKEYKYYTVGVKTENGERTGRIHPKDLGYSEIFWQNQTDVKRRAEIGYLLMVWVSDQFRSWIKE